MFFLPRFHKLGVNSHVPSNEVCLMIHSNVHGSGLLISGATRSSPVALPRFIEAHRLQKMCQVKSRRAPAFHVRSSRSRFQPAQQHRRFPQNVFQIVHVLGVPSELLGQMSAVDCQVNSLAMKHVREVFRQLPHVPNFLLSHFCAVSSSMIPKLGRCFVSEIRTISPASKCSLDVCLCTSARVAQVFQFISPATSICISIFDSTAVVKAFAVLQ